MNPIVKKYAVKHGLIVGGIAAVYTLIAYLFDSITKSRLRRAGQERFDRSNITVKVLMDSFKSIRDLSRSMSEDY